MATKRISLRPYAFDGTAATGLAGEWEAYAIDGVAATPEPDITEAPAGSGIFVATLTGTAGQHITGRAKFDGANTVYLDVDEHVDEWPAVLRDAIAAKLATDHGSGAWGAGASGANTVTVTTTGVVGARVCVRLAGTVLDVKYTNGSGVASFLLDDGTYTVEITAPGYQSRTDALVVSGTTAVTRALTALSTESTSPTGVTRTVDCAAPTLGTSIEGVVAGDTIVLERTVTSCPAALTKAWLTFKLPGAESEPDSGAVLALSITSSSSASGQITDTGADGTAFLRFTLTPAESARLLGALSYDVQVLAGSAVVTPETGTSDAEPGRTSSTS